MNSNKNVITVVAVIILIVLFVLIVSRKNRSELVPSGMATSTDSEEVSTSSAKIDVEVKAKNDVVKGAQVEVVAVPVVSSKTIVFDGKSFSPDVLNVKVGDAVTFSNASKQDFWPASDLHPTHKDYPGSSIAKCGTAEASKIFDACKRVVSGKSWSFKFNEVGAWTYHDHLNAKVGGTVVVE